MRENTDHNSSKYGHFSRSVHIVQMSLNSLAMTLGILADSQILKAYMISLDTLSYISIF